MLALGPSLFPNATYCRLIRCLLRNGRRAEAFEAYRRCRDNLSIILGIKPSAETEALVAELRARAG